MKKKPNHLSAHWKILLSLLFAVAVWCFWYFLYPFLMVAREGMQLFLWTGDYLLERLALPGGLAQYVGEFLVQFFINPVNGAIIYTLLFVLVQRLTVALVQPKKHIVYLLTFLPSVVLWVLACNPDIPMTLTVAVVIVMAVMAVLPKAKKMRTVCVLVLTPVVYWLAGPAAILLALCSLRWSWCQALLVAGCIVVSSLFVPYPLRQIACGIDYHWESGKAGTLEEMEYDMMTRLQQWSAITAKYQTHPSESQAVRNAVCIARLKLRQMDMYDLEGRLVLSHQAMNSIASAFLMSEVTLQLDMVAVSQRSAFEAMEAIPNGNKSARALRRLVETNLVTGQYEVASKYIAILEQTSFYRGWAQKMKDQIEDPKQIETQPFYHHLQQAYSDTKDIFFQ